MDSIICRSFLLCLLLGSGPAGAADALVFAMVEVDGRFHSVLVKGGDGSQAEIVDIPSAEPLLDPLQLVALDGYDALQQLAVSGVSRQVPLASLTILPLLGDAHVAAGTNYAEHQAETDSSEVFLFPKFGSASAGRPEVATAPGVLLDYEIEICAIFDREVASLEDFDQAVKGFFLCSDFTDRATLLRLIDLDDMGNGMGFTDGKSGPGRFAVADRLLVPRDWRSFVDAVPLRLTVNGETRQQALGADMILKLDDIVSLALAEGTDDRWRYGGEPVVLLKDGVIEPRQSILTGTPGGVAMQIPAAGWIVLRFFKWLFTLAWLDSSLQAYLVDEFVLDARASKQFLQPGDRVHMDAGPLGSVTVLVTGES